MRVSFIVFYSYVKDRDRTVGIIKVFRYSMMMNSDDLRMDRLL